MSDDKPTDINNEAADKPGAGNARAEKQIVLARDILPENIAIVPIVTRPLFPKMIVPLIIDDQLGKKTIQEALQSNSKYVGIVLARLAASHPEAVSIKAEDLYPVAVVAEIIRVIQTSPEAPLKIMLGAIERFTIEKTIAEAPIIQAKVKYLIETEMGHDWRVEPDRTGDARGRHQGKNHCREKIGGHGSCFTGCQQKRLRRTASAYPAGNENTFCGQFQRFR